METEPNHISFRGVIHVEFLTEDQQELTLFLQQSLSDILRNADPETHQITYASFSIKGD